MREQLVLIDDPARPWRLDERTRAIGRRGVEHARLALQRDPDTAPTADERSADGEAEVAPAEAA